MQSRVCELETWAQQMVSGGRFERVIVVGMGGASLTAAVFAALFKPVVGYLPLTLLDTTHPHDIARLTPSDLSRCLFIVCSKSGTTVETVDLYQYFRAQLATQCDDLPSRFVLITDAESPLHKLGSCGAEFGKIFINPSDIGGRYSALSYFGMVPAALLGVDIGQILTQAQSFCATTKSDTPSQNPSLSLGMLLGHGVLSGKDKLILRLPDELVTFGQWIEQLIAESTGKNGTGLVPVVVTDSMNFCTDGSDRITIRIGTSNPVATSDQRHPPTQSETPREMDCALPFSDPYQIGAECFRWQIATAIAASYLRINPFDQPDVEQTKSNTRLLMAGRTQMLVPACHGQYYDLYTPSQTAADTDSLISEFRHTLAANCYLGLLAYLSQEAETVALLQSLREHAASKWRMVSTLGIGPRYLHSTGQLHKGGPRIGRFIQFVAEFEEDMAIPQREYTFRQLHRAQADADFLALADTGNVVLRVRLKINRLRALAVFVAAFTDACQTHRDGHA